MDPLLVLPREMWRCVLESLFTRSMPGEYGCLFRVCRLFCALLEELERRQWVPSLTWLGASFKWAGLVNAASMHHLRSHAWQHLDPRAPIHPFVTRNPVKPTAFFRVVVLEALEDAVDTTFFFPKSCTERPMPRTRKQLCKMGLHQEKALVTVVWHDSQLRFSVTSVANGAIIVAHDTMPITGGTLGLDSPLSGPRLDRRVLTLEGEWLAPTDTNVDLSYLLIDPLLKALNAWARGKRYWYSTNPTRRFYPDEQRSRELYLAGIDDLSWVGIQATLFSDDWPPGCYKLLLAVLVPMRRIKLVIHRHC